MESQITLYYGNNLRINVLKSQLLMFDYFKSIFQGDSAITQFHLPQTQFEDEILNIITDQNIHPNDSVDSIIRYILASDYLGTPEGMSSSYEFELLTYIAHQQTLLPLVPYINNLIRMKLIRNIALLYELKFTQYSEDIDVPKNTPIVFYDLSDPERDVLSKMIPRMQTFSKAFIICDIYDLDYNLITAEPQVKDIFLYQYYREHTYSRMLTKNVCSIYASRAEHMFNFIKYFDVCVVDYGYSINEGNIKSGYPYENLVLKLYFDKTEGWYKRNDSIIYDRKVNFIVNAEYSEESNIIDPLLLCEVLGDISVKELPVPVTHAIYFSKLIRVFNNPFTQMNTHFPDVGSLQRYIPGQFTEQKTSVVVNHNPRFLKNVPIHIESPVLNTYDQLLPRSSSSDEVKSPPLFRFVMAPITRERASQLPTIRSSPTNQNVIAFPLPSEGLNSSNSL